MSSIYRYDNNDNDASTVSYYDNYLGNLSFLPLNTQSQSSGSQVAQSIIPDRSPDRLPPLRSRQQVQNWQRIHELHSLQQEQRNFPAITRTPLPLIPLSRSQHDQNQINYGNGNYRVQGSIYTNSTSEHVVTTPKTNWLTPKKVYIAVCLFYLISIGTTGGVIGLYWQMHPQVYNGTNNGSGSGVCGFQGNIMNPVPSIIYVIVIFGMLAGLFYLWRDSCHGKIFNGSKYEGYACVRFNSAFYMGMNTMLVLAIMCTDAMTWNAVSSNNNEQWAKTARILLATGSISGLLFALLHPICCLCFKGARNTFNTERRR